MLYTPPWTRRIHRPKARWIDRVSNDLKVVGVKNWGRSSVDREGWRRLTEEAKTRLSGL